MAFARIEIIEGWPEREKTLLLEGVRLALVEALQVPSDDPTVTSTSRSTSDARRRMPRSEAFGKSCDGLRRVVQEVV